MHFTAPAPVPNALLAAVRAGADLRGQLVSLAELLAALTSTTPPADGWWVRNAVLTVDPGASLQQGVTMNALLVFAHCTFADLTARTLGEASRPVSRPRAPDGPGVTFRNWSFCPAVRFYRCTFACPVEFDGCVFGSLVLEDATALAPVVFRGCGFVARQPPAMRGCRFEGALRVVYPGGTTGLMPPRYWAFDQCGFQDEVRVDQAPDRVVPLKFSDCLFGPMSAATLEVAPTRPRDSRSPRLSEEAVMLVSDLQMRSCLVQGNVTLLPPSASEGAGATWVALNDTTLSGLLDAENIRVSHLSLDEVRIPDGQVRLSADQLLTSDAPTWATRGSVVRGAVRRALDLGMRCDGDGLGILTAERFLPFRLANAAAEPDPRVVIPENLYDRLATQYGELRNAFARVASESREEGLCHYKYKDYARCARMARLRAAGLWPVLRPWTMALVALAIVVALVGATGSNWPLALMPLPIGLMYIARPRGHSFALGEAIEVAFDKVVWKHMLGYGMYARRVFTTAGWVIILCAVAFGVADRWWADTLGWVESSDSRLTTSKPVPASEPISVAKPPAPGFWAGVRNCIYYSVVTFTTLGYGDFSPKGPVQLLAAAEALTGGVLIAFLTVVFARKFIR